MSCIELNFLRLIMENVLDEGNNNNILEFSFNKMMENENQNNESFSKSNTSRRKRNSTTHYPQTPKPLKSCCLACYQEAVYTGVESTRNRTCSIKIHCPHEKEWRVGDTLHHHSFSSVVDDAISIGVNEHATSTTDLRGIKSTQHE